MSCLPYKNEGDFNDSQNVGDKRGKYENKNFLQILSKGYMNVCFLEDTS